MRHGEKLGIALVLAAGCGRTAARPPATGAAPEGTRPVSAAGETLTAETEVVQVAAPDSEFEALLSEHAVGADHVPRVLYTWTNRTQTRAIEANKRFITKTARDDGRRALFEQVLDARSKDPVAQLLKRRELSARRFTWPHAFGTILGLGDERYGDRLMRVRLKPDSIIGYMPQEAGAEWVFRDMQGNEREIATVLRQPERLAAIMHLWPGHARNQQGTHEPFREFVLVNESQVEKLETGTPEVAEEIARMAKLAGALRRAVKSGLLDGPGSTDLVELWTSRSRGDESMRDRYFRALAFGSSGYRPSTELVDLLDRALRELPKQEKFELVPRVKFAEQVPEPPPPRKTVPRKCWGTFC